MTTATSATLSWSQAGGTIPSGYYKLEELKPGQSWVHIASITTGYGSSFSSSVAPYNVPGTYSYRLRACSPDRGCGSTTSVAITLHNRNPVADNESASVNEGGSVTINVLAGDADPDNHGVSISGYSQPSRGSVSCSGSYCTFNANVSISANYNDSFTYTIADGYGGFSTASVSVLIINHDQTVVTPSISPAGHTFSTPQSVSITTSTSGATIYYTTDGTQPTTSSLQYTGSFTVSYDKVVRAIAIKSGYVNSAVNTQIYTHNRGVAVVVRYQYDALGRLVKVVEPVNGDRDYDYDPAGNRQSVTEDSQ